MLRQSRPRRMGGHPAIRGGSEGTFRRGGPHHQQPHGAYRRHHRPGGAEAALRRGALFRLQVRRRRAGEGLGKMGS